MEPEIYVNIFAKYMKGMFLWVKLMLFLLDDIYFTSDIEEIMRTLPDGLPALLVLLLEVFGTC